MPSDASASRFDPIGVFVGESGGLHVNGGFTGHDRPSAERELIQEAIPLGRELPQGLIKVMIAKSRPVDLNRTYSRATAIAFAIRLLHQDTLRRYTDLIRVFRETVRVIVEI